MTKSSRRGLQERGRKRYHLRSRSPLSSLEPFLVALTLAQHVVVACDGNAELVQGGPGTVENVRYRNAWAAKVRTPGAALRSAAELSKEPTLLLAGVGLDSLPFLLTKDSAPRLLVGPHQICRT